MKFPSHLIAALILISAASCARHPFPAISGHRGANFIAPENTLASADSCIRYGVDVMECDVVLSKDSVFYILHDSLLNRTTNGTGPIGEWLSRDLDTLDAGSWFGPEWKGQKLPRFSALLEKAAAEFGCGAPCNDGDEIRFTHALLVGKAPLHRDGEGALGYSALRGVHFGITREVAD